jgi:hypothetical protein
MNTIIAAFFTSLVALLAGEFVSPRSMDGAALRSHTDHDASLRPYACLLPIAGCTPGLQKFEDGDIAWVGCPTWACGATDACQIDGSHFTSCKCRDEGWQGVLCQGVVVYDEWGLVIDWDCFVQQCDTTDPARCTKLTAPPVGQFYTCDC